MPAQIPPATDAATTASRNIDAAPGSCSGWTIRASPSASAGASTEITRALAREPPPGASTQRSLMGPRYGFATGSSRRPPHPSRAVYAARPNLGGERGTDGHQAQTGRTPNGRDRGRDRRRGTTVTAQARTEGPRPPMEAARARTRPPDGPADARAARQAHGARGLRE